MTRLSKPVWGLELAHVVSKQATCKRRQVGAVLFREDWSPISFGYNGAPRGNSHCSEAGCLMVDGHCKRCVHAEVNALLFASGDTQNSILCVTTLPCWDCYLKCLQVGVGQIYYRDDYWGDSAERVLSCTQIPKVQLRRLLWNRP